MQYHLARVMHWIQNRSVEHYTTSILRQLYLNPWAEFAILHLQVLSHGDRLANLVQCFAMIGCTISVSLVVQEMGPDTRAQVMAAAISATIPMGIAQASGTQNDYVAAFWLSTFAYFSISFIRERGWLNAFAAGASLGLALLTKGTSYVFAAPFLVWIVVSTFSWHRVKQYVVIGIVAITLNLGYFTRNHRYFGSPLGVDRQGYIEGYKFSNDIHTPAAIISNVIRNLGLHWGTPFDALNQFSERGAAFAHKLLGIGITDPRTTWAEEGVRFQIRWLPTDENSAGNPLHLALIVLCIFPFLLRKEKTRKLFQYMLVLMVSFLFFCVYLKWQPWHSRLQLPLFVLWSPFVACVLENLRFRKVAVIVLLLAAIPIVLCNYYRPLVGWPKLTTGESVFTQPRVDQYLNSSPHLRGGFREATHFLKERGCSNIGVITGVGALEYALWVMVDHPHIEHLGITNTQFEPCAIVALKPTAHFRDHTYTQRFSSVDTLTVRFRDHTYPQQFSSEGVKVYMETAP